MSTTTHTTVSLPPARAAQLRAIADTRGCNLTEAIEHLIHGEIEAGRLADALPGFEITREGNRVSLSLNGEASISTTLTFALWLAAHFLLAADGMREGAAGARSMTLEDGNDFIVVRRGRGVGVLLHKDGALIAKASMTLGMARDIARQLERSAKLH